METGEKLGRYTIRWMIGVGGMGEVYLAYDEQLSREVVLKLLLPKFARDDELISRFKLEAKAASALNHPNIITIYEIVESDDLLFIVYEFIKGATLRSKIGRKPFSIADSVKILEQIVSGLAAAHNAGIIHRDIKPENIMIRDDGYVKILDFGLAKKSVFQTESESETIKQVKTKEGIIMGSIEYMSPEQARGEKMDERTDIWSLGVVFYEMLTGENPFAGATMSDSISMILRSDPPPIIQLRPDIPQNLQTIIERSLSKELEERYQKIHEVSDELNNNGSLTTSDSDKETIRIARTTTAEEKEFEKLPDTLHISNISTKEQKIGTENPVSKPNNRRWVKFAAIPAFLLITFLVALAGFSVWYFYGSFQADVPFKEMQIEPLTKDKNADLVALSADGKILAYVKNFSGDQTLCVRRIETGEEIDLIKPEKGLFNSVNITKDGNFVYYVLEDSGDGTLYKIQTLGGTSEKIGENIHSNITLSPNEQMFAFLKLNAGENIARVFVVNSDGTNLKELVSSKDIGYNSILNLDWSPDGKNLFLAAIGKTGETLQTISLGTVDIDTTNEPMSTKQFKLLNNDGWRAVQSAKWLKDGSGILFIGGKSADKTKQIYHLGYPNGKITRITNDTSNYNSLDVSLDAKTLVASKANIVSSLWSIDTESKKANQISPETETLINFADISVSNDGRIYYSKLEGNAVNIYSVDSAGKDVKQITSKSWNMGANITPDGKYLLTTGKPQEGFNGILRMDPDGTNPVQLTTIKDKMDMMPQFAPDGTVVFMRLGLDWSFPKLMKVNINGGEVSNIFNDNQKLEMYPKISPDGKYLAFISFFSDSVANSVKMKMKVVEFSNGNAGNTIFEKDIPQVTRFAWTKDSQNLIYLEPNKKMNLLSLSLKDKTESAVTDFTSNVMEGAFTFSPDGKKIYAVRSSDSRELVLIKSNS